MASAERWTPQALPRPAESSVGGLDLDETLLGDHSLAGDPPSLDASCLRIGRYAVLSKLGEGGMGAVYSAYDEELDRRVAIKLVREHSAGDTMGDARMQREAQAMARLSHPNVVQVYDVGTHGGQIFIAMEFVLGSTLTAWQEAIDPAVPSKRRQIIDMYIQAGRGLAAAHRRNLVHRDFKPDNVLVGGDGRARVLDFGLAASARALGADGGGGAAKSGGDELLSSSLTRTGSVMGTPAYMAPEQFLARPSDARTDQFSFCVALYGALYGELPFGGETFIARQACVCDGKVLPPPTASAVPLWLRALLLKGLEPRPEDRHATMEALLEALADDPELTRARRLRWLSLLAGALALGLLIVAVALSGWEAWERHRIEVEASEELAAMESRIVALGEVGEEAEVERTFNAFVRNPAYGGTEALALAWLHRAEREAGASRHREAVDAYAASYAVATSREHQVAALVALIRFSRERERWDGLVEAVGTLEEHGEGSFAEPDLITARRMGAFIRRDFDVALDLLGGTSAREKHLHRLVEALATAHKTSVRGIDINRYSPRGDGEYAFPMLGEGLLRTRADLDLTAIATHSTPLKNLQSLPVEGGGHYIAHDPRSRENVILRAEGERLVEVSRLEDHAVAATLAADLNGDGRREVYIGTGHYTRHLRELIPGGPGGDDRWSMRAVATVVDGRSSDVNSIVAGDLDGDGAIEMVVALGPWRAYELLVLRWDPGAGELRPVTRHKLGNSDAALVRRGSGPPEIAVWKNDDYTTPLVFPPEHPKGEAAGLHLYRLVDDRLEETARYLAPAEVDVEHVRVMVGDLDGDGREEIVVHDARESSPGESAHTTLIFTDDPEDPGGALLRLPLAHTRPVDVRDLDGDGDAELLVRLDDGQLWVVGAGSQRLPRLDRRSVPEFDLDGAPVVFVEVWRRAADLAQMGLETRAAEAYANLASTTSDPRYAAKALLRAGQLYEELGRDELAADHYARAAKSPEIAAEAGIAALRAYRGRGELDRSRVLLDEVLGDPGELTTESVAVLRSARAELGDHEERGVEFDFSQPMDRRWWLHQPHALHRDAARSTLRFDAVGGALVAALPVTVSEGLITLEVELDLHRVEWGETLEIGLAGADSGAELLIGAVISGDGGQGDERMNIGCRALGRTNEVDVKVASAAEARSARYSVRVVVDRERAETSCTVRGAEEQELLYRRIPLVGAERLPEATELHIRGRSAKPIGWIDAELHRLSSSGVEIREGEPLALGEARHALVEGHLTAALRRLGEGAEGLDPASSDVVAWRLMALAQLGRWEEARAVLAPLLVGAEEAEFPPEPLVMLLRTMPEAASGLLRASGATELYQRWLIDAWGLVLGLRPYDPLSLRVARLGLEELDPESEVEPEVMSRLFALRAGVYVGLGMDRGARDDFRTAIEIARRGAEEAGPEERRRIHRRQLTWSLRQAIASIRAGDVEGGRELVVALLKDPLDEAFVRDMLRAWPEFRALSLELEEL